MSVENRMSQMVPFWQLVLSVLVLLGALVSVWVNVNVRLSTIELQVSQQKELVMDNRHMVAESIAQFQNYNKELTKSQVVLRNEIMEALHRIELKLKDKEDKK